MAKDYKLLVDLNLNGNELQNAVIQNLAVAPENPKVGQVYYNTVDKLMYTWDGTNWVTGKVYNFTAPLVNDGNDVISINDASNTAKGAIRIATDTEATTGTATNIAVNPKQLNTKVTANTAITGATKCKITYDSKGLVTKGENLAVSDIPNLPSNKVNSMTGYAKAESAAAIETTDTLNTAVGKLEYKVDNKVEKNADITAGTGTVITFDKKGLVTGKSEIGIDSGSSNYLEFNTSTHKIKAKVDTNVTENSTKLVTSGAVHTAIQNAMVGGVLYQGTWAITTSTADYSGISLPVKKGYLYYVTGTGPATVGGIEWNPGDYLLVNADVASGGSLSGKVEKIDNTEAADIVRLTATQTLTNKTINADNNTITNLETDNLKSGVLQTTVRASSSAKDTSIASEKAVRTELDKKQDQIPAGTANNIVAYSGTKGSFGTLTRATTVRASSSASDTYIPTEKATAKAIENAAAALPHKLTSTNSALTATAGVCTWTISNTLASADVIVSMYEVSTGEQVYPSITTSAESIVIKMNSTATIAAGTYKVVAIG